MKYIVCASGPSMSHVNLQRLRQFSTWKIIVVNNTWELIPWADVLYAGDAQWWERYGLRAVQEFQGEKWTSDYNTSAMFDINHIARHGFNRGLCRKRDSINSGGNSGYQAVNLAYHFGAKRIVLLGFDMHRDNGGHWHGEHEGMLSAPEKHIVKWIEMFEDMADDLKRAGVSVVNATPGSALRCFPRESMVDALR